MCIANRLREVTDSLPQGVRLVAVSKFHPAEYVKEAYDAGQRVFCLLYTSDAADE